MKLAKAIPRSEIDVLLYAQVPDDISSQVVSSECAKADGIWLFPRNAPKMLRGWCRSGTRLGGRFTRLAQWSSAHSEASQCERRRRLVGRSWLNQTTGDRLDCRLSAGRNAELGPRIVDVKIDGSLGKP